MAKEGKKVLLVDTEPQGDLTTYMGFYDQENIPVTIATLFDRTMNDQEINVKDAILHHCKGFKFKISGNGVNKTVTTGASYWNRASKIYSRI